MAAFTPPPRPAWLAGLTAIALVCAGVSACDGLRQPARTRPDSGPLSLQIGAALPRAGVPGTGVPGVVRRLLTEPALAVNRDGRISPRLADAWEWQENGMVLKLTIPGGIRFHDGSTLDVQTAAAILRQELARGALAYDSVDRIDTPKAQPNTILIYLRRRDAFLVESLADIPLAKGMVGTGAFMLDDASVKEKDLRGGATLRAFDSYRQGRPAIDRVRVTPYTSLRSAWAAMMRGDINMLYELSRDAADFAEQESTIRTYPYIRPYVFYVAFNMRHPILARRDVRQALSQAIDRDALVKEGMRGRGEPAHGPVWKYHWAYSTAQRTYEHNPEAARLRLDAAGFAPRADVGGRMPSRLRFTCLMFGEDPRFERIALVLQKQLYDIGVDMQIESLPLDRLVERMQAGNFDAFLLEQLSGSLLMWTYTNWRSHHPLRPGEGNTGYNGADAALDRLRTVAITEAETRSAVGEVQRVFYEDPPALFLAWPETSRAVSAEIGVPYQSNTDIFGRIWSFRRASAETATR